MYEMSKELFAELVKVIQTENNKTKEEITNNIIAETQKIVQVIEEQNKKINILEKKYDTLNQKYLNLERQVRKNNILIFGLDLQEENNLQEFVLKSLNNKLEINLKESDINNIYEIKGRKGNFVKLELISYMKKQIIFQNIKKLKNSKLSIAHDLNFEDRNKNKILVKHLKEAKSKNYSAKIVGRKLIVNGTSYAAEDLEPDCLDLNKTFTGENIVKPNSAPPTPSAPLDVNEVFEYSDKTTHAFNNPDENKHPIKKRKAEENFNNANIVPRKTRLQSQVVKADK